MKVEEIEISKILPLFMQKDSFDNALAKTISDILNENTADIKKLSTWNYIDVMTSEELDILAKEIYVPWYDFSATVKVKRDVIKHSNYVWRHIGTPEALKTVIQDIYGEADLQEYQNGENDLDANEFSVYVASQSDMTLEKRQRLEKAIDVVKRASQVLKEVFTLDSCELKEYVAIASVETDIMTASVNNIPNKTQLMSITYRPSIGIVMYKIDGSVAIAR